jgi:hypothetical protein
MINFANLSSVTLWSGLLALLAWAVAGTLDGATLTEVLGVPMLAAAWMSACVLIDRWVVAGSQPASILGPPRHQE